jgi:hypothetical protein
MTPRENVLEVINWGNPEYVPFSAMCSPRLPAFGRYESPPQGGLDAFGVNWIVTTEGSMPDTRKFTFDDISEWRTYVKFPNLDDFDFKAIAQEDLSRVDRNMQLINVQSFCGLFERMVAFMGFENTLFALVADPDSCKDFFDELSKFEVKVIERLVDVYKPDIITYFDDLAHARNLFMSVETFRSIIKPYHKRIADAITSAGVIYSQHICGKAEELIGDFVEMGARIWSSAQIMNDLVSVQKKYRGLLTIEGGWDTTGPPSSIGASLETIIEAAKHSINTYGVNKGYICSPYIVNERGPAQLVGDKRFDELKRIWPEISRIY